MQYNYQRNSVKKARVSLFASGPGTLSLLQIIGKTTFKTVVLFPAEIAFKRQNCVVETLPVLFKYGQRLCAKEMTIETSYRYFGSWIK